MQLPRRKYRAHLQTCQKAFPSHRPLPLIASLFIALIVASPVAESCQPEWTPGLFPIQGTDASIYSLAVFDDDAAGPNPPGLFVGGSFVAAGGVVSHNIAKWNGTSWESLDDGIGASCPGNTVFTLAVFDDDGDGPNPPALYVGSGFSPAGYGISGSIAKWDGNDWMPVGDGIVGVVLALTVFDDDGNGPNPPALYAGGSFWAAGGLAVNNVAKWDGVSWTPVGEGTNAVVRALAGHDDDGDGPNPPALYAGGWFTMAGGVTANHIAKWDGTAWESVGEGTNDRVLALTSFDEDDSGPNPPALYAGGQFTMAGGVATNYIAQWDGASWAPVGDGMTRQISTLAVFDEDGDGPGSPVLYAGGSFGGVARWSGIGWSSVGDGRIGAVRAMAFFDDDANGPNPPALHISGRIEMFNDRIVENIVKLDNGSWIPAGSETSAANPLANTVRALAIFDDDDIGPNPPAIYAGGMFTKAGDVEVNHIARRDGTSWVPLGSGVDGEVHALAVFDDDGNGPNQPALYAGGDFWHAGGGTAHNVARWDGTAWTPLDDIYNEGTNNDVYTLAVFDDDGNGSNPPALYVGGYFTSPARYIARWDGTSWSPLGSGTNSLMRALAVFDEDGDGPNPPALYAAGAFTTAGGIEANYIAQWDGTSWSPLGSGTNSIIRALAVFDEDGDGPNPPALYAGGMFTMAGDVEANYIAKWDGISWTPVGGGVDEVGWESIVVPEKV